MADELSAGERLVLAERIVALFQAERIIYLSLSAIAFIVTITVGIQAIKQPNASIAAATAIFGSSGIVAISISRLLLIPNKVFKIVFGQ